MALRSQMELIAEHEATRARPSGPVQFGPMPPSGSPSAPSRLRNMGHLRPRPRNGSRRLGEHEGSGSDGECHGEDDEVRSLSLSEDGPVIRRSVSEGDANKIADRHAAAAPDPIAMLTDGTEKAVERSFRSLVDASQTRDDKDSQRQTPDITDTHCDAEAGASADGEALGSDRSAPHSAPNNSDTSAAPTTRAAADSGVDNGGVDFNSLLPVLSKVTGSRGGPLSPREKEALRKEEQLLEVVPEGPGVQAARHRNVPHGTRLPVRPSARRSTERSNVQALNLSQLTQLPPLKGPNTAAASAADPRPQSARSDVSFGSVHSAFSCWSSSSPNSSQLASPRPAMKTTVSMPALTPHKR